MVKANLDRNYFFTGELYIIVVREKAGGGKINSFTDKTLKERHNRKGETSMKQLRLIMALIMLTVLFTGCGKFNAFKELGVNANNIPPYKITGEVTNAQKVEGKEINQKFININAENKSEEEVKKIAGDYIQRNPQLEFIQLNISVDPQQSYTVEYYANQEAASIAGVKEKIKRYPVVYFNKNKPLK